MGSVEEPKPSHLENLRIFLLPTCQKCSSEVERGDRRRKFKQSKLEHCYSIAIVLLT
jgi:hypothetical protein